MDVKHTASPIRGFLDWPVVTDPEQWSAEVALCGIQHSEPYAHDPRPNDQARAPDAIRLRSANISYGPEQWDFDLGAPLGDERRIRPLLAGHRVHHGMPRWR